jgi:hypothetical protein
MTSIHPTEAGSSVGKLAIVVAIWSALSRSCFWSAFAVALILGMIWPCFALYYARPVPDALRWIAHSTSWGFFSVFVMPIGAGLLATGVDSDVLRLRQWSRTARFFFWLLLVLFVILAVQIAIEDAERPGTLPVYIEDRKAREDAYCLEKSLRRVPSGDRPAAMVQDYKNLIGAQNRALPPVVNPLAYASFVLNVLYGLVAVFLAWYLFVIGYSKVVRGIIVPSFDRVILSFACFGLWFPCRVYGSWYAEHFYNENGLLEYRGLFVLAAAFAITAIVVSLLRFKDTALGAKVVALMLFFAPLATAVASLFDLNSLKRLATSVESLTAIDMLAIGTVTALLLGLIVCAVTINPGLAKPQAGDPP